FFRSLFSPACAELRLGATCTGTPWCASMRVLHNVDGRIFMPVTPMQEIIKRAFDQRYGVAAFNIVNDVTMEATLAAAAELHAPLIIQVSVKTVKVWGAKFIQ